MTRRGQRPSSTDRDNIIDKLGFDDLAHELGYKKFRKSTARVLTFLQYMNKKYRQQ